jgi:hypothetical protein
MQDAGLAIFFLYRIIDYGSGPGGEEAALKAVGRKTCGFESCRFRHFSWFVKNFRLF